VIHILVRPSTPASCPRELVLRIWLRMGYCLCEAVERSDASVESMVSKFRKA